MTRDSIWSSAEVEKLQTLMSLGMRRADIAEALGRTQKSIDGKVQYLSLSDEQRDERRRALRRRRMREAKESPRIHVNAQVVVSSRPTHDVIVERARRSDAPFRDLTAAIFGDPPVGYSALERRA